MLRGDEFGQAGLPFLDDNDIRVEVNRMDRSLHAVGRYVQPPFWIGRIRFQLLHPIQTVG